MWTRYELDELAVVGIWLGTHDDVDTINGRFYPLLQALQKLGLSANPLSSRTSTKRGWRLVMPNI